MTTWRCQGLVISLLVVAVASFGCSKSEEPKETREGRLSRANDYFSANQYDKAEKEYREVLRLAPGEQAALRQLAVIYFEQGQLLQAYPLLKQIAERQADDLDVQLKFASALLAAGQFKESRELATQILDRQPGHQEALVVLADTARSASDIDEVRTQIETQRGKDQDRSSYHVAFGVLDLKQNKVEAAENEFKAAINLDPKSAAAHMSLGLLYWNRNDRTAAAKELKTAAELSSPRASVPLRYADFLQRTGSTEEAKAFLEELSRKVPDALPVRAQLMRLACAKQRDEDCTTRVQSILAQDPLNYDALLQDGLLNLGTGNIPKAVRGFEQLSRAYPQNARAQYELGVAYLQLARTQEGDSARKTIEQAEAGLTAAVNLDRRLAEAALRLAELKIRKGAAPAAIELLEPVVRDRPQLAQAAYLLGSAYIAQQDFGRALTLYRQMAERFPQEPQPHFLIGTILLGQRNPAEARSAFEKAASISPSFLPALERLVDLDLADKNFAGATDRIEKQLERDPKLAMAYGMRGKIHLAQRDFPKAEADLNKAIELDSNLEPAYQLLAQLYLAQNKPEQAVDKLNAFLVKNKSASAQMTLAAIQDQQKNYAAARDSYEKVLAMAPNTVAAMNNLAIIYSERLNEPEKAFDLAKRARDANPNEPHIADTLGWILLKRGDYPAALRTLQDSANKLPDSAEIQFHLGSAYYMLGQEGPALAALKKAADSSADFDGKAIARKRVDILSIDRSSAETRGTLESYLKEQPNDPMALFKLAQLQQSDEAIKTYERVLASNSSFNPALRRLAILYRERGVEDPKAFDVTQKAFQAYPEDAQIAKALGILNYRREYYPRASELLKQAAIKLTDDAELFYYLGAAQHQLKQWSDCKPNLEKATSLNLPSTHAESAKRLLSDCTENAT